ncbi:MAG TPA: hypothetical protein VFJ70_05600 [Burkholderiales bacterium]|nr:hypothetical protein [Burkholderiales bacterium]
MNAFLDAAVQLIQVALLIVLVALNFSLRRRLRTIEEKLGR